MGGDGSDAKGGKMIERVRARKERHKQRHIAYRISFATAGIAVILLGLALVPLPGPGWLIVAVGVAMLALEFDRAERLLETILERLEQVGEQASNASTAQKVATGVLLAALALGLVVAARLWDVPYLPI